MLLSLHIENFALIDKLDIKFDEGLNILTGATGAGKSIIIGALDLILGGRGSEEIVRTGETTCVVEANFQLTEKAAVNHLAKSLEIPIDGDNFIVRREYRRKGGGRAFIGGAQVSIANLKTASEYLADILGQHSHQALLDPAAHCGYLDHFAGLETEVGQLRSLYYKAVDLKEQLAESDRLAKELSDRIDLLKYQTSEIEKAGLAPSEEEKLKDEKKFLENSQKIREAALWASSALLEDDGSAVEKIGQSQKTLNTVTNASEKMREIINALDGASDTIRDAVIELQNLLEKIDADPMRLEQINERLDEIFRLKKKYGPSIPDILQYLKDSQDELSRLKNREVDSQKLKAQFDEAWSEMNQLAARISSARHKACPGLEKLVMEKLALMGIPKAQFEISIGQNENLSGFYHYKGKQLSGDAIGFDVVEFQFCANPGEGLKPLAKIASGGEISRVMLALKNAFLRKKGGACEVFDEIDVGISGEVAAKVARQLKDLSRKHQVICITHLHQIASQADHHLRVYKTAQAGRAVTRVEYLNREQRVKEIAALLSGEKISQKAISGAEELLDESGNE